ncbi:hypothetical protein ABQE69_10895 [Mycolicibacillus trivialis]
MKIPIPVLSALAVTSIALTACSTPRTIHDSGPSRATMPIVTELPSGMNPDMAAGAAFRGHPFVTQLQEGCRIWMRLPDGAVWSMPSLEHVSRTGVRMQPEAKENWKKAMYSNQCRESGPAPDSGAADPAAVAAARADGVPYVATAERWDDGCHAWIVLPDGNKYGIDKLHPLRGAPQHSGDELTDETVRAFGCGYGRAPKGN